MRTEYQVMSRKDPNMRPVRRLETHDPAIALRARDMLVEEGQGSEVWIETRQVTEWNRVYDSANHVNG